MGEFVAWPGWVYANTFIQILTFGICGALFLRRLEERLVHTTGETVFVALALLLVSYVFAVFWPYFWSLAGAMMVYDFLTDDDEDDSPSHDIIGKDI